MLVSLVPSGIEGTSYALFTTTWNTASSLSDALSTILLRIWDVSRAAFEKGQLNGLRNLTILTTIIQMTPLLFIWMVPHSIDDLSKMKSNRADAYGKAPLTSSSSSLTTTMASNGNMGRDDSSSSSSDVVVSHNDLNSSNVGGTIFLSIVTLSIICAIYIDIMNVVHPGWMGES